MKFAKLVPASVASLVLVFSPMLASNAYAQFDASRYSYCMDQGLGIGSSAGLEGYCRQWATPSEPGMGQTYSAPTGATQTPTIPAAASTTAPPVAATGAAAGSTAATGAAVGGLTNAAIVGGVVVVGAAIAVAASSGGSSGSGTTGTTGTR